MMFQKRNRFHCDYNEVTIIDKFMATKIKKKKSYIATLIVENYK